MATYPRVECPSCRSIVAGAPTTSLGMVSIHDHKLVPRSLHLCPGSMTLVPARDAAAYQERLPDEEEAAGEPDPTLF